VDSESIPWRGLVDGGTLGVLQYGPAVVAHRPMAPSRLTHDIRHAREIEGRWGGATAERGGEVGRSREAR
jgi:hypothetical protein